MPRKRIYAVIAVLVVFAIVLSASYGVWYAYYRPLTIDEVLVHEHWRAGDVRDVEGTITGIWRGNTSYGPEVILKLSGYWSGLCNGTGVVYGDPAKQYMVGEHFRTTLHFKSYRFNDKPGVWAPELSCPFPVLFSSIGIAIDAISFVSGFVLLPMGMDQSGWFSYQVVTRSGDIYPLDILNASLKKGEPLLDRPIDSASAWIEAGAMEYVRIMGGYWGNPEIDSMDSLTHGTSKNGTMLFADSDADGFFGNGDEIRIRINTTEGDTSFETYMLQIGSPMHWGGYVTGMKYILDGLHGPFDVLYPGVVTGFFNVRHVADQVGARVTSTLEIAYVGNGQPQPYLNCNFNLTTWDRPGYLAGSLADLPITSPNGISIDYEDRNSNGLLDSHDQFVIGGLENRTLTIFELTREGGWRTAADWIAGYGHVTGNIPHVRLNTDDHHAPYRVNLSVPWWHQELNLSRTPTASLWENGLPVLTNVTLSNGIIGTFPGGNLSFNDHDMDGFLSTGDYFVVIGDPTARYRLDISTVFGYRTFRVDLPVSP